MTTSFRIYDDLMYYAITAFMKTAQTGYVPTFNTSVEQAIEQGARRIIIVDDTTEPGTITLLSDVIIEVNPGVTYTFATDTQINLNGFTLKIVGGGGCSIARGSVIAFEQLTTTLFTSTVASTAYVILRDLILLQNSPTGGSNDRGLVDSTVGLEIQNSCVHITEATTGDDGYIVSGDTTNITNINISNVTFEYTLAGCGPIITGGVCTEVVCSDISLEGLKPTTFCDVSGGLFCDDITDSTTGSGNCSILGNNVLENCGNHGGTSFTVACDGSAGAPGNVDISDCNINTFSCTGSAVAVNIQMNNCQIGSTCTVSNTAGCTASLANVDITGNCTLGGGTGTQNIECSNIKIGGTCTGANGAGTDTIKCSNMQVTGNCTFGGNASGTHKVICNNCDAKAIFTLDANCDGAQVSNCRVVGGGGIVINNCANVAINNCTIPSGILDINATAAGECNDIHVVGCQFGSFVDCSSTSGTQTGFKMTNCDVASGIVADTNFQSTSITGCISSIGSIDCRGSNSLVSSCQMAGVILLHATNSSAVGCKAVTVTAGNIAANYV